MDITVVFDIGRTNKKYVLFDAQYQVVEEYTEHLPETVDEDGFPTENLSLLTEWIKSNWQKILKHPGLSVRAVNSAGYGASFVHLDENDVPVAPLYSYLKPFPAQFSNQFHSTYGSPEDIAIQTGSPSMGFLNSGMQLYWLKYARPDLFKRIKTSLHLPQYIIFLLTGRKVNEFTSLGCHTALWSFEMMDYHSWVKKEGIHRLLPPTIAASSFIHRYENNVMQSGFGLHDSSSALIPYRTSFKSPFILISTGTWCINFNPFNAKPLTHDQLRSDCLHYMNTEGSGVKASRLFLGKEHDYQTERIASHFGVEPDFYKKVSFDPALVGNKLPAFYPACMEGTGPRPQKPEREWDITVFPSAAAAYHALMQGLTELLFLSLELVGVQDVQNLYIDGGFARNGIFVSLIAQHYPNHEVYTSELPQATSLGAALHVTKPHHFEFPGSITKVDSKR